MKKILIFIIVLVLIVSAASATIIPVNTQGTSIVYLDKPQQANITLVLQDVVNVTGWCGAVNTSAKIISLNFIDPWKVFGQQFLQVLDNGDTLLGNITLEASNGTIAIIDNQQTCSIDYSMGQLQDKKILFLVLKKGDLNKDGKIDNTDLMIEVGWFWRNEYHIEGDVIADGRIRLNDVIYLNNLIRGAV
jgi:hypothetical protein